MAAQKLGTRRLEVYWRSHGLFSPLSTWWKLNRYSTVTVAICPFKHRSCGHHRSPSLVCAPFGGKVWKGKEEKKEKEEVEIHSKFDVRPTDHCVSMLGQFFLVVAFSETSINQGGKESFGNSTSMKSGQVAFLPPRFSSVPFSFTSRRRHTAPSSQLYGTSTDICNYVSVPAHWILLILCQEKESISTLATLNLHGPLGFTFCCVLSFVPIQISWYLFCFGLPLVFWNMSVNKALGGFALIAGAIGAQWLLKGKKESLPEVWPLSFSLFCWFSTTCGRFFHSLCFSRIVVLTFLFFLPHSQTLILTWQRFHFDDSNAEPHPASIGAVVDPSRDVTFKYTASIHHPASIMVLLSFLALCIFCVFGNLFKVKFEKFVIEN